MKTIVLACDVGGRQDYAALCGIQIQKGPMHKLGEGGPRQFVVTYLDQMLGLGYLQVEEAMTALLEYYANKEPCYLVPVVDARGVGAPIVELLAERDVRPIGLMATTGFSESRPSAILGGKALEIKVSNTKLLAAIRTARANDELVIDEDLDMAGELAKQMMNVEPQLTEKKKSERFDAPTGQHDDLLAATMMGLYVAQRLDATDRSVSLAPLLRYVGLGWQDAKTQSALAPPVGAWT